MLEARSFWIRGTATTERRIVDTTTAPSGAPLGWRTERERIVTEFRVRASWGRVADSVAKHALTKLGRPDWRR